MLFRLGVTGQHDVAAVGGGQMDVDHLHGREFLQHRPGGQAGRQGAQPMLQRHHQTIGDEGDEDMRLDAMVALVVDRPDRRPT